MNSFRISIIALSVAPLMFSAGSSSPATTDYSHPRFTVADDRTLNLRETGSNLVMETIEDALRAGGLALLGEGFRLDSSLVYVTEESSNGTIKGEIDLVLPFYNENGHVIFTQPGLVFWEGQAEEERVDGNLGIVYRTNLANTPVGIDAVGGASLFYDYDLHRAGHERLGIGVDMQGGDFQGAFNYYYPLSNVEDGREGFVEEALKGMDLRVALERETIRAGARVGLWRYDGGEDVADEWRTSIGLEGGVRIVPGVFVEGEWEKHQEDVILDQRLSLGLAFRFSLPDFEGQGYKDGSMSSDLYRIVEREKRVLYEERVAGPKISIVRTGNEAVIEGGTIALDIELSEALEENVTVNLVGSGSAEYGSSNDYTVSVDGTACTGVTEDNCQVSITAGQTTSSDDVEITINDDGRTNELSETIVLSMVVASAGNTDLTARGSFTLTIPADPPLPTVSLSSDDTSLQEGDTATITLTLSESLGSDATFNLIGSSGSNDATYGTSTADDWNLSVGGTDCNMASRSNPCTVVISQGDTTAEVIVEANTDSANEGNEIFTISVEVDSGSTGIVLPGNSSSLDFSIQHPGGTIGITSNLVNHTLGEGMNVGLGFEVSDTGALAAILDNNITLTRTITITGDEENPPDASNDITISALEIDAGLGNGNAGVLGISVIDDDITEEEEVVVLTLTDDNNVLPPGWSIDPANNTMTITIPANDQPLPTVSLSTSSTNVTEGDTRTITLTLSEALGRDATFHLVTSGDAGYGLTNGDWVFTDISCVSDNARNACPVMISQGATTATTNIMILSDTAIETMEETATVTLEIDSANRSIVQTGSPSSLSFTIKDLPTVSLNYSGSTTIPENDQNNLMTIELSEALTENIMINIVGTVMNATYGDGDFSRQDPTGGGDYEVDVQRTTGWESCPGITGNDCQITIAAGTTTFNARFRVHVDFPFSTSESMETATISIAIDMASNNLVQLGSSSSLMFNIPAD